MNLTTKFADVSSDDVETKPCSIGLGRGERFEQAVLNLRRDAGAIVGDAGHDVPVLARACDGDFASRPGGFDRVLDQVEVNLA